MRFLPPSPRSCLTGLENSSTGASPTREDIMLRMVLLGMLIPLSVGFLAAMELRTPPRRGAAVSQPDVETVAIPDSLGALAKTDRLKVTYASTDTPAPPPQVDDRISTSQTATSNAPETLRPINRHPLVQIDEVPAAALPKSRRRRQYRELPSPNVKGWHRHRRRRASLVVCVRPRLVRLRFDRRAATTMSLLFR
jgi:hypothetical protein